MFAYKEKGGSDSAFFYAFLNAVTIIAENV